MEVKLEADGFEEAIRAFENLPGKLMRNAAAAANRQTANRFRIEVQRRAPVRRPQTSGSVIKRGAGASVRAPGFLRRQVKYRAKRLSRSARMTRVSHIVHKGRARYGMNVVRGHGNARPNPYVAQAFHSYAPRAPRLWSKYFVLGYRKTVRQMKQNGGR